MTTYGEEVPNVGRDTKGQCNLSIKVGRGRSASYIHYLQIIFNIIKLTWIYTSPNRHHRNQTTAK